MKNERLFAIVNFLLERGRAGAPELARRFEVSVRTIYRDMDSLSANGVPIVALPGADGGYEIAEGFRIDRSFLSGSELDDITGALRGFSEALKTPGLASSLGKLSGLGARGARCGNGIAGKPPGMVPLLRKPGRPAGAIPAPGKHEDKMESLPPPLIVSLTPWGGPSPDPALVELCRRAIDSRRPIIFDYSDSKSETTERIVEPYSLVLGAAVWYLHAWCRLRCGFRLFRLSRMGNAGFADASFDPLAHGAVPTPFFTETREDLLPIVLRTAADRRTDLVEAFGDAAVETSKEGRIVARFAYPAGDWLLRFLLQLGPDLEVVEPPALREELFRAAQAMAEANR